MKNYGIKMTNIEPGKPWQNGSNERRPHSSQNYITPEMVYFGVRKKGKA